MNNTTSLLFLLLAVCCLSSSCSVENRGGGPSLPIPAEYNVINSEPMANQSIGGSVVARVIHKTVIGRSGTSQTINNCLMVFQVLKHDQGTWARDFFVLEDIEVVGSNSGFRYGVGKDYVISWNGTTPDNSGNFYVRYKQ